MIYKFFETKIQMGQGLTDELAEEPQISLLDVNLKGDLFKYPA